MESRGYVKVGKENVGVFIIRFDGSVLFTMKEGWGPALGDALARAHSFKETVDLVLDPDYVEEE